jgi:hypothetical protein
MPDRRRVFVQHELAGDLLDFYDRQVEERIRLESSR